MKKAVHSVFSNIEQTIHLDSPQPDVDPLSNQMQKVTNPSNLYDTTFPAESTKIDSLKVAEEAKEKHFKNKFNFFPLI